MNVRPYERARQVEEESYRIACAHHGFALLAVIFAGHTDASRPGDLFTVLLDIAIRAEHVAYSGIRSAR